MEENERKREGLKEGGREHVCRAGYVKLYVRLTSSLLENVSQIFLDYQIFLVLDQIQKTKTVFCQP
jgi:hypothetical protein